MSMDGRYVARSQGRRCDDAMDGRYVARSQAWNYGDVSAEATSSACYLK